VIASPLRNPLRNQGGRHLRDHGLQSVVSDEQLQALAAAEVTPPSHILQVRAGCEWVCVCGHRVWVVVHAVHESMHTAALLTGCMAS
jgi:hypothetical protein